MIGILEIVFIVLMACVIWFVVFTALIKYKQRKFMNDLLKNFEDQEEIFFNGGKKYDVREELKKEKLKKEAVINSPTSPEGEAEVNKPTNEGEDFSGSDVPLASPSKDDQEKKDKKGKKKK